MFLDTKAVFTGTQVNYFIVCPTKLWLFSHFVRMEQNSDLVSLGKLLHEESYKRDRKEIMIDSRIAIDFVKKGDKIILHEIKKSRKLEKAHYYQILYYLYYLKRKGVKAEGMIDYPKIRKNKRVVLSEENERELEDILDGVEKIISKENPPKAEKKKYCRKCSYFEFCWT